MDVRGEDRLARADEEEAVAALRLEVLGHRGWLGEEDEINSFADLACVGAARISRSGDWVTFATDDLNDPKWTDQAEAFFLGLGRWVRQGNVVVEGEDGERWGYRYGPEGVEEFDGDPT